MPTGKERQPRIEKLTLERIATTVKDTTLRLGNHLPTIVVEGSQQTVLINFEEMGETLEKRIDQMRETGWAVGSLGIVGVLEQMFFVSKVWFDNRAQEREQIISPSKDQQYKECLLVSLYNIDTGKVDSQASEMLRDTTGKLTNLKNCPLPSEKGTMVEAPLLAAFLDGYIRGLIEPPMVDE